jgi:uncharacterized damage-inducible protein DinB
VLDWEGPARNENAIGSLLYHIALVEMSWLFFDILEQDFPPAVKAEFPHPMSSEGRITSVLQVPLADHLKRLGSSRSTLLEAFRGMSLADWGRSRSPEGDDYTVTPAWAVFHLVEHEASHTGQINSLKKRAERIMGDIV